MHSDHLGSTSTTTCGNSACGTLGAVLARQSYYPYGGVRDEGDLLTDITFTGYILRILRFNGATLFQAWKPNPCPNPVASATRASMGPRFFKRGNRDVKAGQRLNGIAASMGPRFFKRGNDARRTD